MIKILIIDDDKIIRERLKSILDLEDYRSIIADDGQSGLKLFKEKKPDIVLLDIKLPGMSGIEVLKELKKISKDVEVIIITGHGNVDSAIQSLNEGAFGYIQKPIEMKELEIYIKKIISNMLIRNSLM